MSTRLNSPSQKLCKSCHIHWHEFFTNDRMDTTHAFPLSLDYRGEHFEGTITPSQDLAANGKPVYFRVMIGDTLFAYLCCGDTGWQVREENGQHQGLVSEIGNYINRYYEYSEIE